MAREVFFDRGLEFLDLACGPHVPVLFAQQNPGLLERVDERRCNSILTHDLDDDDLSSSELRGVTLKP